MLLTAIMQVKAGALTLQNDPPVLSTSAMWTYGAFMGCVANFLQESATNHPFATSGQSLGFAWLYWRHYCQLRGWHAAELIDETCRAFEQKHVPGWNLSNIDRDLSLESDSSEGAIRTV